MCHNKVLHVQSCRLDTEWQGPTRFAFLAHNNASQSHVKYPKVLTPFSITSFSIEAGHKVCVCAFLAFSQSYLEYSKVFKTFKKQEGHKVCSFCALGCILNLLQIPRALVSSQHKRGYCLSGVFLGLLCCKACTDSIPTPMGNGRCQSATHLKQHSMRAFTQCTVRISQCIS